ncbi:C2 calcium-dependent membrane-targeting protein [Tanacetum coccineum]
MIPKEYKHLTKKQRKMTQAIKMFVVKASTMKLGATRAHNLYSKMKGGAQYVHGTSDDFKNDIRDVNAFKGESYAQMLITKMENRKKFVPNFTFEYKVKNSELVAMFWADEVDKCNYKEFGDIISFDATFRTNKYDMVFVPFTGIDNHRKCVIVGSRLFLREDTEAYTWLLTSFVTAHEKQPTMIVTDQDGAMNLAIEKICKEIYDETDFKDVGDIIVQTDPIVIPDSEETLALAEESHYKMLLKHKDNMMLEKEKQNSVNSSEPTLSIRPTNVEVPKELPKVSMVNMSLKKLKHHLANFDVVVKESTIPTAITEGL